MIFTSQSKADIPNQSALTESLRNQGGQIRLYYRVFSLLFFTSTKPVFVWLPPGRSPHLMGLFRSIPTLLFGWWSLPGLVFSPFSLAHNIMGGCDTTELFQWPPPLPSAQEAIAERMKKNRFRAWAITGGIAILLTLLVSPMLGKALTPSPEYRKQRQQAAIRKMLEQELAKVKKANAAAQPVGSNTAAP